MATGKEIRHQAGGRGGGKEEEEEKVISSQIYQRKKTKTILASLSKESHYRSSNYMYLCVD